MAKQINIEIFSGDTFSSPISFVSVDENEVESPMPITGFTCFFTAKRNIFDSIDSAVVNKVWSDHDYDENGLTTILLDKEDTVPVGSFYYCFGYFTDEQDKKTVFEGKIVFKKSSDESTEP